MGNATSSEEVEEEQSSTSLQGVDEGRTSEESLTNFSSLLQPDQLYKALLAIKEPPGSALCRSRDGMIRWLSGLADKGENSVNMVQVVEHLTEKGVSKEEALEFFNVVDREGEGHVDIAVLLMVLKDQAVDPMQALVPCHLKPGPLEVYLHDKCCQREAGRKIVEFLHGRRVKPNVLVVGPMRQIIGHQMTREKLVQGRYQMVLHREEDNDFLEEGEGEDGQLKERIVVSKCYSAIGSSSSQHQIKNLTDNRMDTYWQSSGSPRSHWIRLRMLPGMAVRELAVSVQSSDDSYMPSTIVVSVGNSDQRMTEIKTVHIPRGKTGSVVLVKNLGRIYQCVQINIRGCHNDGCDCKLRGLHVKGSKMMIQEEKMPTVQDTIVVWYMKLLASTAQATFPGTPALRSTLIAHSRSAMSALQPLVLSPTSPARPEFLSSIVIDEMELTLQSLCSSDETVSTDCLEVLLAFSIAHGNVNSILDCLHTLLSYQSTKLNLQGLLYQMEDIKRRKYLLHAEVVQLTVVSCSGGSKDENRKPENILSNDISNTSATPYVSSGGQRTAAVVLHQRDGLTISPTRLVVQVPSADNAATTCLMFLLEGEPEKSWLEALETHSAWDKEKYLHWLHEKNKEGNCLISRLEFSKDSLQVDISPDVSRRGRSLVIVVRAVSEEVESVAVQAVRVFGHCQSAGEERSSHFLENLDTLAPLESENGVTGSVLVCRTLVFLSVLLQDLAEVMHRRRLASLEPSMITEPHLAVEGLSLQKIWRLYLPLISTSEETYPALLVLWLLKSALPFIKPERPSREGTDKSETTSSAILSHLCALLDRKREDVSVAQRLAEEIVVKGVAVFFPDSSSRRKHLLEMIGSVLNEKQPRSWWLQFQALCQYFTNTDANSLLGLPSKLKEGEEVDTAKPLELLSTLLAVACRESQISLLSGEPRPQNLVSLLCALQASFFFWCCKNITETDAQGLLLKYVEKLVSVCIVVLREITAIETGKEDKMKALQNSLLTRTLAEMLIFLATITRSCLPRMRLMDSLYPLVPALQAAVSSCPTISHKLTDLRSGEETKESVVGVWTRESPHNYENNAHVTEEFVCPSATKFVVEFDSRCVTERRYDYLEFTDVTGVKHKFDGKYNSERWPQRAEFPGPTLQFLFHSDGSNNEWGYLFTLKAYGQPAPSLHWLLDLQLSLARLLGQLTSATLSMKRVYMKPVKEREEEKREEALLTTSDLWRTLFRGGYMLRKLTRSLSGAHMASPAISELNSVLHGMAGGEEGRGKQLVNRLRETEKGPFYGGERVDKAVDAVFAALIWHCQDLREELAAKPAASHSPSHLLKEAFLTAEALRRELVEGRQKLLEAKEKEASEEERADMNEDSPLISCYEKALFLLKFAGLSRVDQEGGLDNQERVDSGSAVSTVGRLKQQLSLGGQAPPQRKPPSFDLVLSFVKNEAVTEKKVHHLLQERERLASSVAQAYTSAANYITAISIENMFELPGLMFLQQLVSQQGHFPIHYAAKLDGCGLELENQVRKAYRLLIMQLLDGLAAFSQPPSLEYQRAKLLVSNITCHLLDCQWQSYDHLLLADLQISDFLLQSAISWTQTGEREKVEKFEGEEAMLARYRLHMDLLEKDKELGGEDFPGFHRLQLYQDNKWEGDLFIEAKKWAPSAGVAVQCDGCQTIVRDIFYHNMDLKSESFDLCPQCFTSGNGSRPDEHTSDQLYLAMDRFFCSHCNMCIMTHRFHSNTRDNIELCLGCFRKEEAKGKTDKWTVYLSTEVPASGSANRYMTSDPETSSHLLYEDGWLSKVGDSVELMVYQQQHCWLLFSSLCLTMAHCLNAKHSAGHEKNYREQARVNLLQCLRQLAHILHTAVRAKLEEQTKEKEVAVSKTTTSDEEPTSSAIHQRTDGSARIASAEETFSLVFLTPSLYCLAAVLPGDGCGWGEGTTDIEQAVSEQVLPALLEVAVCTIFQPTTSRLACIVAAQYMSRISPQMADVCIGRAQSMGHTETEGGKSGVVTARFFFSLGAGYLHKSDFSGAATIAECLLILSRASPWRQVVSQSVLSPLSTRVEEMDLSSIFALMVLAGFPKLHREGSLVQVHTSDQPLPLAVLTSVDGDSGTVVSPGNREPQTVKLSQCEVEDTLRGCITHSELSSLLPLLHQCLQLSEQESERQVESTWILALSLKALLVLLKSQEAKEVVGAVMKEGLMVEIARLASRATRLSWKWLASDLEVVAIRSYQPPGSNKDHPVETEGETEGEKSRSETETGDEEEAVDGAGKQEDERKKKGSRKEEICLEGLTDEIQDMLMIMQEAFQCPLATLRALFDASGADINKFIMSSEQYYDLESATLKPPEDIVEAAAKLEVEMSSADREVQEIQDSLEDTGVTCLLPVPYSLSSLEAEPERADLMKRLKSSDLMQEDSRLPGEEESQEVGREESFQLLQEQLKGGVASRRELLKTQQAIVVLYARHVLAALLSCWQHPPHLSTSDLGSMDEMQLFCLLDLLMRPLSQSASSELLHSVIHGLERTQLASLSVRAVEVMRRVNVGCEKRQFQHPLKDTLEEKGKVVIASASSLSVSLSRTPGAVVDLGSNEDMSEHRKTLSSDPEKEVTHLIPGNTLHYRVRLDAAKEASHTTCCTLTVTGIQMGRFTAGLRFLEQLLTEAGGDEGSTVITCVSLSQLWPNLIAAACQLTGQERLKIVCLLLQLLALTRNSSTAEHPDLSALKPLWQLYTTMVKEYESKSKSQQVIVPLILRSLTELFLRVEDMAQEWGVSQTMVVETLTKEGLGALLEKGISNVAFLSLALGLENAASIAFTEAKKSYVPPVEDSAKDEEEEEEEEEEDNNSTSEESDSSGNSFESEES